MQALFYNKIGCICSFCKAYNVVSIIYFGSNESDLGFVIGLSCLNGTKNMFFLFNNFPIFSAFPS